MFASKTTRTVPLPSDQSITVTIGKLSWMQRRDAAAESQRATRKDIRDLGGMDEFKKLFATEAKGEPAQDVAPAAAVEPVAPDPFLTHDTMTVLVCGVKAWSAPEPVTKETLADLGEEDAEGLARAILALSLPSPTLEADRKNAE